MDTSHDSQQDDRVKMDSDSVDVAGIPAPCEVVHDAKDNFQPPEIVRTMTPGERERAEKALVRKIDFRLLPMVVLMYIMNYLDRNNIAAAKLAGLEDDLNLSSIQYSVRASLSFQILNN